MKYDFPPHLYISEAEIEREIHLMKYALCIVAPPIACLLANRKTAAVLNVPLCVLGWLPGVIHAVLTVNAADADRRVQENAKLSRLRSGWGDTR